MSAIEQYINRIPNAELQQQLREEVGRLTKKKRFGLVWENHLPDNVLLPEVRIRRGTKVALRDKTPNDVYEVQSLTATEAVCVNLASMEQVTLPLAELMAVAQRGDVIYPYLKHLDSVQNAPESDLWHTLIEADNYHALQLLTYLYAGQVDCIYIDPPYNKPDSHDWKYNCDYVDGTDSYRHSKWLSMMEGRLKIAKKLLNPKDSVLIVTIDELEYHHLGCLLEQMFPEARIQMVSICNMPGGVSRLDEFSRCDEYAYFVKLGEASPCSLPLGEEWMNGVKNTSKKSVHWEGLLRTGTNNMRSDRPNLFYPVIVSDDGKRFLGAGDPLALDIDRHSYVVPEGTKAIWPIHLDGTEGCWRIGKDTLIDLYNNHVVRLGGFTPRGMAINYLKKGEYAKVLNGTYKIKGIKDDNSYDLDDSDYLPTFVPATQWVISLHDASRHGSGMLSRIFQDKRFSFPKSLYAVHDALRFFVANKPDALILDFFAGSGTTLHAVNLLNAEDGGHRRCIMVTNNEIGEPKEKELMPQGIKPGDEEWERWGIARYVNWPRTKCSILGTDVNGQPIEGNYLTSLTETKESDRKFTQINFLPLGAALKQKKSLLTLINKQKGVKLPTMTADAPYLLSEDDGYNASILFDVTKTDEWKEALEGNDHITNFFIVTDKDSAYRQIKSEVSELMGKIEETIPVEMPMRDGFKANAAYFKLGFLDKRSVERGRQLQELLPLLWMKAGAKGECPKHIEGNYAVWPENRMALLTDEAYFTRFQQEMKRHKQIDVVYLITDSQTAYLNMTAELKGKKTYQLYRDYLENFRINYAVK